MAAAEHSAASLYPALHALLRSSPCIGFADQDRRPPLDGTSVTLRFRLGSVQEFGPFSSAWRELTIDNFVCVMLSELFPWISGVHFLPDTASRALPSCHLLAPTPEAWNACRAVSTINSAEICFSILRSGLIAPRPQQASGPPCIFYGLPARGRPFSTYSPQPLPSPTPSEASEATIVTLGTSYVDAPTDPACVTVKIRGLHACFQRHGATAAFLVASGYPPSSFSVIREFLPPLEVHRARPPATATGTIHNHSAMLATVFPPPHDPMMRQASLEWALPDHPHKVRVTVIPSLARPVRGAPFYPAPEPIPLRTQRIPRPPHPSSASHMQPPQRAWQPASPPPPPPPSPPPVTCDAANPKAHRATADEDAPSSSRRPRGGLAPAFGAVRDDDGDPPSPTFRALMREFAELGPFGDGDDGAYSTDSDGGEWGWGYSLAGDAL